MRRMGQAIGLGFAGIALALAGCSSDSGGEVRDLGGDVSGSGSGTGLSATELSQAGTGSLVVATALAEYRTYVNEQVDTMIADTKEMTDAIREGDLQAAKAAYASSRIAWERIEPIAGLIEDIDGKVDARVDDFAGVNDPDFTGWHRIEYLLWEEKDVEAAKKYANQLDKNLATLKKQMANLEIPPAVVPIGASELIEEVSLGKITGEEDRYSKTDLWDFAANVEGAEKAIEYLTPALQEANPERLTTLQAQFADLWGTLEPLRRGDGWVLYCLKNDDYPSPLCNGEVTVSPATVRTLKAQLAGLSESTSSVAGDLGLS